MTVHALLGIHHTEVSLCFPVGEVCEVERYLNSTQMEVHITPARTVVLRPFADGKSFSLLGDENVAPGFDVRIRGRHDKKTARARNHPIDMVEGSFMGGPALLYTLPADHLLPWPQVRDCDIYWPPDEIFEEIMIRRRSCVAHRNRWDTPPGSITSRLTPQHRKQLYGMVHGANMDISRAIA